eukprot:Rmarinus@m.22355
MLRKLKDGRRLFMYESSSDSEPNLEKRTKASKPDVLKTEFQLGLNQISHEVRSCYMENGKNRREALLKREISCVQGDLRKTLKDNERLRTENEQIMQELAKLRKEAAASTRVPKLLWASMERFRSLAGGEEGCVRAAEESCGGALGVLRQLQYSFAAIPTLPPFCKRQLADAVTRTEDAMKMVQRVRKVVVSQEKRLQAHRKDLARQSPHHVDPTHSDTDSLSGDNFRENRLHVAPCVRGKNLEQREREAMERGGSEGSDKDSLEPLHLTISCDASVQAVAEVRDYGVGDYNLRIDLTGENGGVGDDATSTKVQMLLQRLKQAKVERDMLREEVEALQALASEVHAEFEAERDTWEKEEGRLQSELAAKKAAWQKEQANLEKQMHSWEHRCTKAESELSEARCTLEEYATSIQGTERTCDGIQKELLDVKRKCARAVEERDQLKAQVNDLEGTIQSQRLDLRSMFQLMTRRSQSLHTRHFAPPLSSSEAAGSAPSLSSNHHLHTNDRELSLSHRSVDEGNRNHSQSHQSKLVDLQNGDTSLSHQSHDLPRGHEPFLPRQHNTMLRAYPESVSDSESQARDFSNVYAHGNNRQFPQRVLSKSAPSSPQRLRQFMWRHGFQTQDTHPPHPDTLSHQYNRDTLSHQYHQESHSHQYNQDIHSHQHHPESLSRQYHRDTLPNQHNPDTLPNQLYPPHRDTHPQQYHRDTLSNHLPPHQGPHTATLQDMRQGDATLKDMRQGERSPDGLLAGFPRQHTLHEQQKHAAMSQQAVLSQVRKGQVLPGGEPASRANDSSRSYGGSRDSYVNDSSLSYGEFRGAANASGDMNDVTMNISRDSHPYVSSYDDSLTHSEPLRHRYDLSPGAGTNFPSSHPSPPTHSHAHTRCSHSKEVCAGTFPNHTPATMVASSVVLSPASATARTTEGKQGAQG